MGQDVGKIQNVYDTLAREYAEAFAGEHESKPMDREMLLRFSQEIGDRRPVWDFGCGPGHTAAHLKELGLDISGLDLSERMLDQARAMHPGMAFRQGNILGLEFENDSIAGVVSFYAMVHFTPEQAIMALREIFRVLKPGGLFLGTFHIGEGTIHLDDFLGKKIDIDFMFFPTAFVLDCLKARGFERMEAIEREPYPYLEYQSRRAYVFAAKPVVRPSS